MTIEMRQEAINVLHAQVFGGSKWSKPKEPLKENDSAQEGEAHHTADDDLLDRAFAAHNKEKFTRLFDGDLSAYHSHSEADLALCRLLAFWTRDEAQIDRLFRRSKLYRGKWDENHGAATYGERTIAKATDATTERYSENDIAGQQKNGRAAAADSNWQELDSASIALRQRINVADKNLPHLTELAWDAIANANEPPQFFRYGNLAARVEHDDSGYPIIRELTVDRMRYVLSQVAYWYSPATEKKREQSALPPLDLVRNVLATPDIPLPILSGIVEAPTYATDGTLQTAPGYNRGTQTFYFAPVDAIHIPTVSEQPTADEITIAKSLIVIELLGDFPFASNSELAHAVGFLLFPFVRKLIHGPTPLHLIEKPSPGTGGTLLADMLAYPAMGHEIPVMTEARTEEEWRKRITAKLMNGPLIVFVDNVGRRLESPALAAAITSSIWEDRIMGRSEMTRILVQCAWIATGNNPILSSEIARRTIRIRLDAKMDQPWRRNTNGFRHANLRRWATAHRSELIWAALTLVKSWLSAGRPGPQGGNTLGMFEGWAAVIGGILKAAGIDGFLQNLDDFYEDSDLEGKLLREFVLEWWNRFGGDPVGVSQLFDLAIGLDPPLDLGNGSDRSQKTRLGVQLARLRDRQFDDLRVVSAGAKCRASQFRLMKCDKNSGKT